MTRSLLVVVALALSTGALAVEDYNAIFEAAVDAVDFEFDRRWAYTETRVDREHVWVGRFDPRRPAKERWRLLSVDDRAPTDDEIKTYQKDKAKDQGDEGETRVNALVEPDSVRLIEENDEHWLLSFTPDEDESDIMDSVDATIRIRKPGGELEYIDLRNHAPFKPAIGVKISKLITRLTFAPAIEGGPHVPVAAQVEAKGRAFLVISFDEQELVRNSDFERVLE